MLLTAMALLPQKTLCPGTWTHITATALEKSGVRAVGLLATRFTMEEDFYRDRLAEHHLRVLVPEADDREAVHRIIYEELCRGVIREESRRRYQEVIARLVAAGAEGIILGCTPLAACCQGPSSPPHRRGWNRRHDSRRARRRTVPQTRTSSWERSALRWTFGPRLSIRGPGADRRSAPCGY